MHTSFFCDSQEAVLLRQTQEYQAICDDFSINTDNVVIEIANEQQSFSHRRLLKELINHKMNRGDTLVLPSLTYLGRDTSGIQESLSFCTQKAIDVCFYLPCTNIEPISENELSVLISIQTLTDIKKIKLSRGRYRNITKQLGRKEGSKYYDDIQIARIKGYTQSQTAKQLGVSTSTVKRHWSNGIIG